MVNIQSVSLPISIVLFFYLALPHPGNCNFDKDWCYWKNLEDDEFDWLRNHGRTLSSSTGPESDVSGKGFYAYIEASWPRRAGNVARLVSPVLNGTQCMRFYYNMFGRFMGDLQIYVEHKKSMIFLWGRYKNQGVGWHSTNVTVYGNDYKVLIMGRVGKSYTSDMAIDDISFVNGTCDGLPLFSTKSENLFRSAMKQKGEFGSCNFDGGFCEWINVHLGDDFDWTLHRGGTGTTDTGPLQDHTNGKGYYLYIEASNPRVPGQIAQLLSPRLCGTMCLEVHYHLYGSNIGELVIYQRRGLKDDDRIWSARGEHGDVWNEALIDISGNCYQIVIEGKIGYGYLGDAAIDDIIFTKGTCCEKRNRKVDVQLGNCHFDNGFCQWKNPKDHDDFDWTLLDKNTPSTLTGPDAPYEGKGQYAYVESSEPRLPGDKAILVGPVLGGSVCLSFRYHMYGEYIGSLSVFKHGSGVHRRLLWKRKGNMGNLWRDAAIDVECKEPTFQLEFEAVINGWRSDIAVDDIQFSHNRCNKTRDAPIVLDSPVTRNILIANGNCSFPGTFCEWKNDQDDDFDWEIRKGSTPSLRTGPERDVDGNGHYIFIEASNYLYSQKASLRSGLMNGKQCMTLHYHMYGSGVGALALKIVNTKTNYKNTIWRRSGTHGQHWIRSHVNTHGNIYKIALEATVGRSTYGDIAVDDISFTPGTCMYEQDTILDNELPSHLLTKPSPIPFEDRAENCTFEDSHMCKWINLNNDRFDWILWKGSTPSRSTGPSSGHRGQGTYIYAEATAPRVPGDKARLSIRRGPSISCMGFYYHMYGETMGELKVITVDIRRVKMVWTRQGSQGNQWKEARITLESTLPYQVILEAVIGRDFRSDIALDDITFTYGPCQSDQLLTITTTSPSDSMQGDCANC